MRIDVITCVPGLLDGPFNHSILRRAVDRGLLNIYLHDLRAFGIGKHKQIDDYQYGSGAGMVMMAQPLADCIDELMSVREYCEIIYMTPDGRRYDQQSANRLSLKQNLLIICGHYKGIDERIREHYVTMELSIGDYVLSGGELAAAVVVDSIGRLIPGAINDGSSALTDSFQDGLLSPPVYSRPAEWNGYKVPEILLSGDDKKIEHWRYEMALRRTLDRRPDLLPPE